MSWELFQLLGSTKYIMKLLFTNLNTIYVAKSVGWKKINCKSFRGIKNALYLLCFDFVSKNIDLTKLLLVIENLIMLIISNNI